MDSETVANDTLKETLLGKSDRAREHIYRTVLTKARGPWKIKTGIRKQSPAFTPGLNQ